jgi:regulator of protease activity HflC (stomatin/prohibitin superfamily)
VRSIKVVPQQNAWVVERLGKYHGTLTPGLNFLVPFIDRLAYQHSLKEVPLDVPSQVCITRDNTQLQVDGILYFQVTDPMRASYGSSNYLVAITQLAQTSLRSVIGKLELDKTFEERDIINAQVVAAIDEAAMNWGVKVLRYEIKDLTPPKEILLAMQSQITAEREKRALIAASEGRRQEQINIATGEREAFIARSEGEKLAAITSKIPLGKRFTTSEEMADMEAVEYHRGKSSTSKGSDTAYSERPSQNKYSRITGKKFLGAYPSIYPLIGSPDEIVAEMKQMHEAGLSGLAIVFLNYLDEMPYFNAEVLPRLERAGLRVPLKRA